MADPTENEILPDWLNAERAAEMGKLFGIRSIGLPIETLLKLIRRIRELEARLIDD